MPAVVQKISYLLPSTYLFEGVRFVVAHKAINYGLLGTGFILCVTYLAITYYLVNRAFAKSKIQGLSRLE